MYTLGERTEQLILQMYKFKMLFIYLINLFIYFTNGDAKSSFRKSLLSKTLHKYSHFS